MQSQPSRDQDDGRRVSEGEILRIIWRNGVWFGFIKRGFEYQNVYFDSRGYRGEPRELIPNRKVRFEIAAGDRGSFAKNVTLCD